MDGWRDSRIMCVSVSEKEKERERGRGSSWQCKMYFSPWIMAKNV